MKTLEEELIRGFAGDLFSSSELNKILSTRRTEEIKNLNLGRIYDTILPMIGKHRAFKRLRFFVRETERYLDFAKPKESDSVVIILNDKNSKILGEIEEVM